MNRVKISKKKKKKLTSKTKKKAIILGANLVYCKGRYWFSLRPWWTNCNHGIFVERCETFPLKRREYVLLRRDRILPTTYVCLISNIALKNVRIESPNRRTTIIPKFQCRSASNLYRTERSVSRFGRLPL